VHDESAAVLDALHPEYRSAERTLLLEQISITLEAFALDLPHELWYPVQYIGSLREQTPAV